jgi:hypothetical protein
LLSDVGGKESVSTNGAGPCPLLDHRESSKDVKITLFDTDVLQGNHTESREKFATASLFGQSAVFAIQSFQGFCSILIASPRCSSS